MLLTTAFLALAFASPEVPAAPVDVVKRIYTRHFAHAQRIDRTLRDERDLVAAPLLALLDADATASAASPGEIVGLDFDPLVFAQTEADGWKVGAAKVAGAAARVPVELRTGSERVVVTVHLARVGGRWRISDLDYGETTLVKTLQELAAERKRP